MQNQLQTTKEAITIRRAAEDDAVILAELGARTIRQTYGTAFSSEDIDRYTSEAFSVKRLNAELANPEIFYLLATVNQQPAALRLCEASANVYSRRNNWHAPN